MIFSDEFITSLKNDPIVGARNLIQISRDSLIPDPEKWHEEDYAILLETYALLLELIESDLLQIEASSLPLTGNFQADCVEINGWINQIDTHISTEASKLKLKALRTHFKASLGTSFCYEFSQGDLEKIQALINELRNMIAQSTFFEKDHQQRLLKRLEHLQSEMHKRISDLDKFWGLIGDAGVVIGKFGADAKPFVDRIREIADVVWRTQARAEELPSGTPTPLLGHKNDQPD